MSSLGFALFDTPIGRCAVVWGERGIVGFQLPEGSDELTRERIAQLFPDATERDPLSSPDARRAIDGVIALLGGAPDSLSDVRLDLRAVPDFDGRVYAVTRAIEPGSTLTYGEVAARIGSPDAAQAVGQALGRNPIPILVPCHRVLAAGGKTGGFSAHGGAVTKRALLTIERAPGFDEPTLF
ncbi:methylated-DNA--[protein]-cysteine S-methyltransferase [Rhodococcus sp. NPDC058514]|uniref:methylated-DNA--[protein]-cysteine S-methyltransferase n=1 Tax=unclassified Rhodococcus (in: high G+C Gram-positive bacteria) TaxID=192944 RepID=UPI0036493079